MSGGDWREGAPNLAVIVRVTIRLKLAQNMAAPHTPEHAKSIPRSSKTVLFGYRSPTNLSEQNVDWLAALVGREYDAAHCDRQCRGAFYLSDC
jgi:hypothetical protein